MRCFNGSVHRITKHAARFGRARRFNIMILSAFSTGDRYLGARRSLSSSRVRRRFYLIFFFFLYTYTKRLSLKTRDGTGERWRMGETSEKRFAVRSPAKFVSRRKSRAGRLDRTRSSRPSHGGLNLGGKKSHFKVFNV